MNPWPIAPITDHDLNFAVVSYDFASFTNNEQTDLPSLEGAIDVSLLDYAGSIAEQTTMIASMFEGLEEIFSVLKELGSDDFESMFVPLSNSASAGDLILTGYQGLLGDSASSGGGGGGGGTAPPSSDCSQRTNQYGISNTGAFPGVTCNWKLTFQVLRVQDGPCTYSAAPAAQTGDATLPTINAFNLQSGDAGVWQLSHHTAHASDGSPFDVIDVHITPKTTGHFDAVGLLIMNNGSRTWHVCMSVDFIP